MPDKLTQAPSYNLWYEPWIMLERPEGGVEALGIEQSLLMAHEVSAIYEQSPLAVVGIHRMLTAILQEALGLSTEAGLKGLWQSGRFPPETIRAFGERHRDRFDLFSETTPFYQSADLPLSPAKGQPIKSVAYLAFDIPSGTAATHFRHGSEERQVFCPRCAACGLVTLPTFATSGGAGIKPSINGVPPIYVIPGGPTLFESLAHSILLPAYQPAVRDMQTDQAWWARVPVIPRSAEVMQVGYLHSLTFAARRVRLHPEAELAKCTRCGELSRIGLRTMVFEMGESRPKEAPFWYDPFASYRVRDNKPPVPVRPSPGKAAWREFGGLFLQAKDSDHLRPKVLDQMANMSDGEQPDYLFRCIGMRTDMKAKIFEWIDAGFQVPVRVLQDDTTAFFIRKGLDFAGDCAGIISGVFRQSFGGKSRKSERYHNLKVHLLDDYWEMLSEPFRQLVIQMGTASQADAPAATWREKVLSVARRSFHEAASMVGNDAASLRQRVEGEQWCTIRLNKRMKEEVEAHG